MKREDEDGGGGAAHGDVFYCVDVAELFVVHTLRPCEFAPRYPPL